MASRTAFGLFLRTASALPSANKTAVKIVDVMHKQMVRESVPMSPEHLRVATESLSRGDDICKFLAAENPHVIESTGSGIVYQTGKCFHKYFVKNASEYLG
jgi:hypothetical protein